MEERRSYMTPFWLLLVLTVIRLAGLLYTAYNLSQSTIIRFDLRAIIFSQLGLILVMIAETLAYWYMRKFRYRKFLAKWHIALWYAAIFLWPTFFIVVELSAFYRSPNEHLQFVQVVKNVGETFYWACLLCGHAFFAAVIVEGIRNRRKKDESPGPSEILEPV